MKRRLYIALVAAGALSFLVPVSAHADHTAAQAACVVVDSPPLHLQVGYAPNGPEDCTKLP